MHGTAFITKFEVSHRKKSISNVPFVEIKSYFFAPFSSCNLFVSKSFPVEGRGARVKYVFHPPHFDRTLSKKYPGAGDKIFVVPFFKIIQKFNDF